jgi:HEAT repeat protein
MTLALDEESRLAAAARLVGRPTKDALEAALSGLGDRSWRVRKASVEAVLAHPDRDAAIDGLVAALRDEANAGKRNSAVEALVRLGAAAVPTLLGRVGDPDPEIRKVVVDVLGEIGDRRTVPALVGVLADGEGNVRTSGAEALGKIGDERAYASLLAVLEGADLWLQHAALAALGRVGRPVPRPLLARLVDHAQLRRPVYDLIGQVKDAEAADLVLAGISDRGRSTREAAVVATWALWEGHPSLRGPLTEALRARGETAAWRDAVASVLASTATGVRLAAGALLAVAGDDRGVAAMLAAAADERCRASARAALGAAGPSARRALEATLGIAADEQRELAATLLGDLPGLDPESAAALAAALGDAAPQVRAAAALALGRAGQAGSAESIAPLLLDPVEEVRGAAIRALGALAACADALVTRAEPLLAAEDPTRRRTGARLLGEVDGAAASADRAVGRLAFALKDHDVGVRQAAAAALGRLGRREAGDALVLALADESADVRIEAAGALGRMRSAGAVEALCLLVVDPDPWVRAATLEALGAIGAPSAFTAVVGALKAAEPPVVLAAVEAAVAVGGEAAAPHLLPLLASPEPEIVKAAARRLAGFGGAPVTAALLPLLGSPDWGVRAAAAEALGRRRAEEARAPLRARLALEEDEVAREAIRRALEALG